MGYVVGIDLGTTFTAAAVGGDGAPTMVTLGHRSVAVPSLVFPAPDGTVLVGDRAEAAGMAEPARLASEFKRRFGDTTPLVLGGQPYSPQALMATLLRSVLDQVEAEEGAPPDHVTLTHPANWGPYKRELLDGVPRLADVRSPVSMLTEPEAAAGWYARQARVPEGATVAVYDLGGGTFDAALLSQTGGHFSIVGRPLGIEQLGGIDIDHTLVTQLLRILGVDTAAVATTAEGRQRLARQRAACIEAKEALSLQQQVAITNWTTPSPPTVSLSRAEFEMLVGPLVDQTVTVLGQSISEAGRTADDLHAVLLVGGTSRIPLVASKLSDALGRPVTVDAHPKNAVALGAAAAAQERAPRAATGGRGAATRVEGVGEPAPAGRAAEPAHAARSEALMPSRRRRARRPWLLLPAAVALAVALVATLVARRGDDGLTNATVAEVLSMDLPTGWHLETNGRWDDPVPLGPNALQAHPGLGLVGTFETDPRAFVFIGVPDEDKVSNRVSGLKDFLDQQTAVWNPSKGTCNASQEQVNTPIVLRERWSGCRGGPDTFLQQAWRIDGRPVYALARMNDQLSEDQATRMLESVRLLSPSG